MEITLEKIAMIREHFNPTNADLNLGIDWSVEYMDTNQRDIKFDIILRSVENYNLNFKMCGLVRLGDFETFVQNDCSEIIFHHACTILMNMLSLTRQSNFMLFNEDAKSMSNLHTIF